MDQEKKNKIISAGVTAITMLLLMVFMICCGFTEMVPPPPAKKAILIELTSGGGGGGGVQASQHKTQPASSSVPVATQNAEEAPVISGTHKPKTTAEKTPVVEEPKPDVNAAYRPGRGGGSGGGSGTGSGSGSGSGLGPGTGGGYGGGIGYGTGTRNYKYMPEQTVSETGQVCVEVHVDADGNVIDARVISNNKYPTTITNRSIQAECVAKAKTAKYVKGKEELRIIVFK
jgi:protein TonB